MYTQALKLVEDFTAYPENDKRDENLIAVLCNAIKQLNAQETVIYTVQEIKAFKV